MCGIFATIGSARTAPQQVFQGLQKLDYRGYDSWGIGIRHQGKFAVYKTKGKIEDATITEVAEALPSMDITAAIGHTRWATHGGVTDANAHPHMDMSRNVIVVHNGIIDNYQALRKELEAQGVHFYSDTDSEVIPNIIQRYLTEGHSLTEAARLSTKHFSGRYAFVCMTVTNEEVVGVRMGSPLILGKGSDALFLSSDVPAFLEHTRCVNYIDDGELVHITGMDITIRNIATGDIVHKDDIIIEWSAEDTSKGDYAHYMLKEIMEQKETIRRAIQQDPDTVARIAMAIRGARRVFISGCGTAGKVAHAAQYFFSRIAHIPLTFEVASEFSLHHHALTSDSLLIVISQSGETADVLEAIEYARSKGTMICAITNVEGSTIHRASDHCLFIHAGPEKAVASTKAATAQLAVLHLLAYATAHQFQEGQEALLRAQALLNDILNPKYLGYIEAVARTMHAHDHTFIIGKAAHYPMALEAAIKIQEVSYIHAQGFAGGELKHGPIALIQPGTPCLVLVGNDETKTDILSNAIELKARGAHIIGIAPEPQEVFDQWIATPDCGEASAITSLIPLQLLAYYLAVLRGNNPDKPRNLAKSVTVK